MQVGYHPLRVFTRESHESLCLLGIFLHYSIASIKLPVTLKLLFLSKPGHVCVLVNVTGTQGRSLTLFVLRKAEKYGKEEGELTLRRYLPSAQANPKTEISKRKRAPFLCWSFYQGRLFGGILSLFITAVCSVLWLVFAAIFLPAAGRPAELPGNISDTCCKNKTKEE